MKKILLCFLALSSIFLFSARAQTTIASFDFEDNTQDTAWHFVNATDGWFIGSASGVNNTAGGSRGIYISNDNGASNSYGSNSSNSWAYIDVTIPAGYAEFLFEFDWKCYGESVYDYMKVFVGAPSTPSGSSTPTGAVALENDLRTSNPTYFNGYNGSAYTLNSSWNHYTYTFQGSVYGGQTVRLYFYWHDDTSVQYQPPVAVDNISLTGSNCGRVYNIVYVPTPTDIAVSFSPALATDNAWEYICIPADSSITGLTPISISDSSFTVSGLTENSDYVVYVRTDCGTESSNWNMISCHTTCLPLTTIPYYEGFDSIGTGETIYPDCWSRLNTYTSTRPYVNSTHYGTGTGSLYFFAGSGTYNIAVMPAIDASIPINTLMATFMYRNTYATDYLIVGVMTNPTDSATFVPVDTIQYSTLATWHEFEVAFNNYSGNGQYIAFINEGAGTSSHYAYIDNVSVDVIPTCMKPIDVTVSSITTNGATVTWTPRGNESSWEVVVVPNGEDPDLATPEITSVYPYTLTNLTENTLYQVYVRSNCDADGYSNWTPAESFRTGCPDYITLPYTENFDTYGGTGSSYYPQCWSRRTNYSTTYPYLSSNYAASSPSALYFYASTTDYSIAISPTIDTIANPINTLSVTFKLLKSSTTSTYGRCEIGVMTDPTDTSTFTTIATVLPTDLSATYTWYEFDYSLAAYTGSGAQYIAFRAPSVGSNYFYLDDVTIYTTPSCLKPLSVELSQLSSNSVTVNWTPRNSETAWNIAVVPTGTDVSFATPEYATTRPYTVSGLTDNTTYDVYVQADCGSGDMSTWSSAKTFTSLCLPTDIVPYTENFDNCTTGQAAALPDCWLRYTNYTSVYPYTSSTYHASGSNSIYFYASSTNYSYLVSQALDLSSYSAGSLHLTCKTLKSSSSYGRLNIGYMTDPTDLNTFVLLKALYPSDYAATATWYERDVVLNVSSSDPIYLAFVAPQGGVSYAYLDDIYLDYISNCSDPSHLAISDIAGTSALVSWTASLYGATDYTVEYSESGMDTWNTAAVVTGTQTFITGLTPATAYDVRVSANCSSSTGNYVTGSFSTGCLAGGEVAIGSGTSTTYNIPVNNLWRYTYSQQIFDASEMNGATQIRGIKFQYAYASPMTLKTNVVVYLAHTTQSTFTSTTSWIPIDSATQVYSGALNCSLGWNTFNFTTPFNYNGTDNLVLIIDDNSGDYNNSSYTFNTHSATNKTIYYYSDGTNPDPASPPSGTIYSYRNNVKFLADCDSVTTCVAPNAYISDIDDQSATLTWAPGNGETSWEIEYMAASDAAWTQAGTITSSPYVISALTANTDYSARIRSVCSPDNSNWVTLSFSTECAAVSVPLMENFDAASGSGTGNFIGCWSRGTNYASTSYPYTSNSYSSSSPYSLYFYGTLDYYSYAASPRFEDAVQMDSLQISFQMYKTSAAYFIEVGIMTDPNDIGTFVPLGMATPTATGTWELAEINTTGYNGTGHYVAFRIPQWTSSYMYIDDISIQYIPNCLHVENMSATNILAHSADILWTAGGDETTWDYLYGPVGTVDFDNDVPTTVTTNQIQLTGLIDNTIYDVYVRGLCQNGEYSTWMSLNFRTACDEVSTLPYSENFDTYNTGTTAYPTCWSRFTTYSSNYPYISSTNYSGSGSLYFYTGTTGTYNIAIMTPIATTIPVNTLQVTFQYRVGTTSNKMIVGVMSDPTNPSTFVPVDTVSNSNTDTWYQKRVSLGNYTGTDQYIAFKSLHTSTYTTAYLDQVEVDILPSCDDPSGFAVTNLNATSADLVWHDAAGESNWQLLVVPDGVTPDFTTALALSSSSCSCTGLAANTVYHAYLRTVCSNGLGYSNWINTSFMTISANPAQTPYFHDFEDGAENAEWVLMNGTCTNKWYIGQPTGVTDSLLFISSDNGNNNTYDNTSTSNVWAYRDIQFGAGAEFSLSVKWHNYGESCCDYLRFYIGTPMPVTAGSAIIEPAGAVQLNTATLNLQSSWQTFTYTFDGSYANTTQRLYILWHNDGSVGTNPPGAIDSVEITVNDCGRPYDITVSNLTTTSADVTFTRAMAADMAWQYVVGAPGFNPSSATPVDITDTSFQITNLTAATDYQAYVRTACASGGFSSWSAVVDFTTLCDAVAIPYTENFDTYGSGSSDYFPGCWTRHTTYSSNYPYISSTNYSSPGSLYFYAGTGTYNMAVTPQLDVTSHPMNNLQVTFQYRPSNATSRIIVGVMTDNTDVSTFVPIDTVSGTSLTWAEHTVMFNNYTGTGTFVAFKNEYNTETGYGYLDNVYIEDIPTCPRPTSLNVTASTTNSITLSWTETGSATAWNIEYGVAGFTQGSGTIVAVTTNPYTVTGLTATTNYDFYLRADCGGSDVSTWSNVLSSYTACDVVTSFPYTENFDSYTASTSTFPNCWSAPITYNNAPYVNNAYYTSSPNSLKFISLTTTPTTAVTPQLGENIHNLQVAFKLKAESTTYSGTFEVGVMSNPLDVSTFESVQIITPANTNFNADTISFAQTTLSGSNNYIAFRQHSNSSAWYFWLDDVVISVVGSSSTCDAPTGLTSAVTTTTATVSWTETGNFEVAYKLASATDWSSNTAVTGSTTTLTGLTANTAYDWRVRQVCDASTNSSWATGTFTTAQEVACPMPTNLAVSGITNTSATLSWDQEAGTATEWTLNYRRVETGATWTTSTISTNPYTIVDLLENTPYEVQLRANCPDGTFSNYTDVMSFITTGINNYTLANSISLYPNPTSSYIDVKFSDNIQVSELKVYDVYGKLLQTITVNENPTRINVSEFADGVYFVRAFTEDGIANKSFIKR